MDTPLRGRGDAVSVTRWDSELANIQACQVSVLVRIHSGYSCTVILGTLIVILGALIGQVYTHSEHAHIDTDANTAAQYIETGATTHRLSLTAHYPKYACAILVQVLLVIEHRAALGFIASTTLGSGTGNDHNKHS